MKYAIACDLGTGGCKSSLYDAEGICLDSLFRGYPTYYPAESMHEQKPEEWWSAVKESIKALLKNKDEHIRSSVVGIGLSGHSLGMVPLDSSGKLLMDSVPIWSDSRPGSEELTPFFEAVSEEDWYMLTGNGFPPALYTVFKILWMKNNMASVFEQCSKVIGTKDYINFRLCGEIATDYSYASGSGVYDLENWRYSEKLIEAAKLSPELFPRIKASTDILGTLSADVAQELGLPDTVSVVAGGVDNSCMALGAKCFQQGRMYNSLGSSSWIAVSSDKPLLDLENRPYVFTHVVPGLFASATAIFSAGSSHKWFSNILSNGKDEPGYEELESDAASIAPGSGNLIFNPSLAGGSSLDKSPDIKGAFLGLSLSHERGHLARSVMEGVGYGLKVALDVLAELTDTDERITIVGGGCKSKLWCQILADIFNVEIVKTNIDQQAAALGAASLVLVGCGVWDDFSRIDSLHKVEAVYQSNDGNRELYDRFLELFKDASSYLADFGIRMRTN